ncbi:WxL domain-containing protein [Loigolactobacillus zhaoyuanensis]|uniref:WxL domain-containing protein n=1 Tax=Loigolactobacillus zhaoyuanensis TaxID=2486017 RepID=UPI000F73C7E4|nr:WxL domain-containing protein [Loigolactobacillus zhaoyuanensis]
MIKKSALVTMTMLSGLLAGGLATSVSAAVSQTEKSTATATFTDTTDPTNPIDPEDPDPSNPGPGPGTGETGPLTIDYVSDLDFGTHDVPKADATYTAANDKTTDGKAIPNFVQVTDQRSGAVKGWTLTVMQDAQFTNDANGKLEGAQLKFSGTAVTTTGNTEKAPTTHAVTLDPGTSAVIMDAGAGAGFGTWADKWGKVTDEEDVSTATLKVPVAAHPDAATYTSNLTWTLTDVPATA